MARIPMNAAPRQRRAPQTPADDAGHGEAFVDKSVMDPPVRTQLVDTLSIEDRAPRLSEAEREFPQVVVDARRVCIALDDLANRVTGDLRRLCPELAQVLDGYAGMKPSIDERMKRLEARFLRQARPTPQPRRSAAATDDGKL